MSLVGIRQASPDIKKKKKKFAARKDHRASLQFRSDKTPLWMLMLLTWISLYVRQPDHFFFCLFSRVSVKFLHPSFQLRNLFVVFSS